MKNKKTIKFYFLKSLAWLLWTLAFIKVMISYPARWIIVEIVIEHYSLNKPCLLLEERFYTDLEEKLAEHSWKIFFAGLALYLGTIFLFIALVTSGA